MPEENTHPSLQKLPPPPKKEEEDEEEKLLVCLLVHVYDYHPSQWLKNSPTAPVCCRRSSRVAVCVICCLDWETGQHDRWTRFNPIRVKDPESRGESRRHYTQLKKERKKKKAKAQTIICRHYHRLSLSLKSCSTIHNIPCGQTNFHSTTFTTLVVFFFFFWCSCFPAFTH